MIEDTIASLEQRLQSAPLSAEQRAEIEKLLGELRSELAAARRSGAKLPEHAPASDDESPLDRLNQSVTQFERSHPQLVTIVNRISTVLANMGI